MEYLCDKCTHFIYSIQANGTGKIKWCSSCKDTVYIIFSPPYLTLKTLRGSSLLSVWRHHQFYKLWKSCCLYNCLCNILWSSLVSLILGCTGSPFHGWITIKLTLVRSKDCAVVRAIASHKCRQGLIPGEPSTIIYELSLLLVLSLLQGFSLSTPDSLPPQNWNISKFQFEPV